LAESKEEAQVSLCPLSVPCKTYLLYHRKLLSNACDLVGSRHEIVHMGGKLLIALANVCYNGA
jgi:hypothetical protein